MQFLQPQVTTQNRLGWKGSAMKTQYSPSEKWCKLCIWTFSTPICGWTLAVVGVYHRSTGLMNSCARNTCSLVGCFRWCLLISKSAATVARSATMAHVVTAAITVTPGITFIFNTLSMSEVGLEHSDRYLIKTAL